MDENALDAASADLVAWGLLEPAPALVWSRRFRAAVARAASRLAMEERAGRVPDGPPLLNAVREALAAELRMEGTTPSEAHVKLLVGVELAALPEGVRDLLVR